MKVGKFSGLYYDVKTPPEGLNNFAFSGGIRVDNSGVKVPMIFLNCGSTLKAVNGIT